MTAVTVARKTVRMMASLAPGVVSASRNAVSPVPNPRVTTTTVGRTIISPRYRSAVPRRPHRAIAARAVTHGLGPAPPPGRGTDGRSRVCALTLSRDYRLGLRERALGTEHRVALQLVPATEVVGREQVVHGWIRPAVTGLRLLQVHGPLVPHAREEVLRLLAVEVLDERVRDVLDAMLLGVLVHHGDVREDPLEQLLRRRGVVRRVAGNVPSHRGSIGGDDVPPGTAALRRVGRQDLQAGLGQVGPVLDVLGVAGPDVED